MAFMTTEDRIARQRGFGAMRLRLLETVAQRRA